MPVDVIGIEMLVIVGYRQRRLAVDGLSRAVEAGAAAGMAGRIVTGDLDLQPDGVLVAVDPDFLHRLQISELSPFFQILPRDRLK